MLLALVGLVVAVAVLSGWLAGSWRTSRKRAAAPSEAVPPRLADILDRVGVLEAELKNVRREWEQFEESTSRRWGTITRQLRRDRASEDAAQDAEPDPMQLEAFAPRPVAPAAPQGRVGLRPARLRLGQG